MKTDKLTEFLKRESEHVRMTKAARDNTTDVVIHGQLQTSVAWSSKRLREATLAAACRNGTPYENAKGAEHGRRDPDATLIAGFLELAHTPAAGEEAKHKKLCLELAHAWKAGKRVAMPWWPLARRRAYHLHHMIPLTLDMFDIAAPRAETSSTLSSYR